MNMTPEQQKEFTDAIEARIEGFIDLQSTLCEEGTLWNNENSKKIELQWALERFNQIKNK